MIGSKAVLPIGKAASLPALLTDASGAVQQWRTSKPLPDSWLKMGSELLAGSATHL